MFNIIRQEFQYGNQQVVLETGRIARQANSVLVHMGGVGFGVFVPSGVALAGLDANMVLGQVTVGWP